MRAAEKRIRDVSKRKGVIKKKRGYQKEKGLSKRKGFRRFIQQKTDTQKNPTNKPSYDLCLVRVLLTRSYPSVFFLVSFPATRPKASLW
jgi:hypothetical protein